MANPVVHWEIAATNAQRTKDFFEELFDWEIETNEETQYHFTQASGEGEMPGIGGGIYQLEEGMQPGVLFYVLVENLEQYLDKAESIGGQVIVPPQKITGVGTMAIFCDPDGNRIGLFEST